MDKNKKSMEDIIKERQKKALEQNKVQVPTEPVKSKERKNFHKENVELLGKIVDELAEPVHKEKKQKVNKNVSIEIDFKAIEEYICTNHNITDGFSSEYKIFNRVFKPYKQGSVMSTGGRDLWIWNALKDILIKNANKFVKKVTREDVI